MNLRHAVAVGVAAAATLMGFAFAANASAATTIPVPSKCHTDWYVNGDEGSLLPKTPEGGFLFDGPSLVHHAASGKLTDAANDGSFTVHGSITGALPLFKFETLSPYSTINKTAAGLYWSSKIPTGVGSQASPTSLATLAATAPYTPSTTLLSFGVGYANDKGNAALVTSVHYAGKTYSLTCFPKPSHTATPKPPVTTTVTTPAPTTVVLPPVNVPVRVTVNPGQFAVTPNTSKGVDTGDGSLS